MTVEFADLTVEFGVMHGDVILSIDDLHLGDEVRIKGQQQQQFASNIGYCRHSSTNHSECHALLVSEMKGCVRKHQLELIDASGSQVTAYVISPMNETGIQPYLLLPRQFNAHNQYCMIAITLVTSVRHLT